MSNSNHEESLTGFPPHTPAPGGGDVNIVTLVVAAAGASIGATPVSGGAAALEIMVDTFVVVGWGWLMLTASVSAALESAAAA